MKKDFEKRANGLAASLVGSPDAVFWFVVTVAISSSGVASGAVGLSCQPKFP